jgi:putative protein-disulfide isomerase
LQQIENALAKQLSIQYLLGGLAPDSDEPMPADLQQSIQQHWRKIENLLGTEFNFSFWQKNTPRRSTYPASRAVLAAAEQQSEKAMILAIQQAYYLRAMNPSDDEVLLQVADELGLDFEAFMASFYSEKIANDLLAEIQQTRSLGVRSFPSWVLEINGKAHTVPLDYQSAHTTLAAVSELLQA